MRDAEDAVTAAIDRRKEAKKNLNAAGEEGNPLALQALQDARKEVKQARALLAITEDNTAAQKEFNQARSEMTGMDLAFDRLEQDVMNFKDTLGLS